ncbi:MAG: YggT family protein [Lachnospiraceae bacterium]|nr:YggT family protein [Lachnospiraceae bacterium]
MILSSLYKIIYVFLSILEGLVLLNMILSFLIPKGKIRNILEWTITPLLVPVRFLIRKSVIRMNGADISYIITYVIIYYLRMLIK